jgi:NADH-quinone oxidoreductase subunit G
MPKITIDGVECEFEKGEMILQVANRAGLAIPQYCYHDGLSIVASCRICLAEVWAPNPRAEGKLEPIPKLLPTCQTPAAEGQVVYSKSPKAVANQKAVMEYLLISHPLDCPVCDQAGECLLQDYSYEFGRGASRYEEAKIKQAKKNVGEHILLYSDRCIMCTRCVRFAREVSGTGELIVGGRGNKVEIDVFPGVALDNPLSANVIDLCPVGALLDKDFLFAQRVWFLKSTPSVDGITASGDNIWVDHNEGKVYRLRPRENLAVNKWWITDEVRYGWKHVHSEERIAVPLTREYGVQIEAEWNWALDEAAKGLRAAVEGDGAGRSRLALMVSPMLSCEDAWALAKAVREIDSDAILAVGPVPVAGEDRVFPEGIERDDPKAFVMVAEKAPNARGVRRVLESIAGPGNVPDYRGLLEKLRVAKVGGLVLTGNYPSDWSTDELAAAMGERFTVVIDTLSSPLSEAADVVLPSATWVEKAGTFVNARGLAQAFEAAIPPQHMSKAEAQIGIDLMSELSGERPTTAQRTRVLVVDEGPGQVPAGREVASPRGRLYNAANLRREMAEADGGLAELVGGVSMPATGEKVRGDMEMVEL